jgi:ribosome-associated protein
LPNPSTGDTAPLPPIPADIVSLHEAVIKSLDDDKAEEILSIPLAGKTAIADYMVIASGRSSRQVAAMAEHLQERLRSSKRKVRIEGLPQGDWVLIDAGDVIVHLFRPEVRSFYNLEKMWSVDVPVQKTA